jgi:hypothetical protein
MTERFGKAFSHLVRSLSAMDTVRAIGKSGGDAFPEHNEGDVDVFVFCERVPDAKTRQSVFDALDDAASDIQISETANRFWGTCDFFTLGGATGTEVCLLYFAMADMNGEITSVLSAQRLDREDEYFYPTGRCAAFLTMYSLYDADGYIAGMKEKLSFYPPELSEKLYRHHQSKIHDAEDFQRAVSRGDVLFYHATLEIAIDHFLQALFALNRCFFPSRKRTLSWIEGFAIKPANCAERLLQTIELGARAETLAESYAIWCGLCKDLLLMREETMKQKAYIDHELLEGELAGVTPLDARASLQKIKERFRDQSEQG